MPVMGVENCPIQLEGPPTPSVTVPNAVSDTFVPVALRVNRIGEPAKTTQDCPRVNAAQFVVTPAVVPNAVMVYRTDGCAANWMKGLFEAKPPPATIGLLFANSTPSPETRQPGDPSTPEAQPANIKAVVLLTSAFHGGPGGIDVVSVVNVMLLSVTVVVPLPDDVFNSPTTVAEAIVAKHSSTSVARAAAGTRDALIFSVPPPIRSCLR